MFFAALFASYFTIRSVSPVLWAENTEKLNVAFAAVNTTVLVLSSLASRWASSPPSAARFGRWARCSR